MATTKIPYLTKLGAANLCGVRESTIRAAVLRGELSTVKTQDGKIELMVPAEVRKWNKVRPGKNRGKKSNTKSS